ncbi:FHA domain family protein [Leishmania donovani]|uniref:Mediator of DNA damage checkpoint protein 1 n=1 Tax=Leishmania donovani TaxID=5661 RepID=A0A504XG91_LEIDO|nr:FHA domain family protein [Leishmania donovani]
MSQLSIVKDQLLSKGINHFVVLSSSGQVVEYSGDFEIKEKQVLAYAIIQQCSALFAKGESMKRVTMKFDDVLYVATTVQDSAMVYGVVAKPALASSLIPPSMSTTAYALVANERQYPLQVGKNVVGRSSVPVEGVSFINLESPLAAISRMQAFVDIGANGDAWISDCNSTNGTFLSIRPGPGIRLEANRYYQLSPGCRIVFGDVVCTFETLSEALQAPEHPEHPLTSLSLPTRKTESLGVIDAFTDSAAKTTPLRHPSKQANAHRSNVPYLDESGSLSREPAALRETVSTTKKAPRRERREPTAPSPPLKRTKVESAAPSSSLKVETAATAKATTAARAHAARPHVCLTGMDSDERAAVTKRVRELKGRVVDDITKANLLVVAAPPVRTPKFIVAVARGIPVVSVDYICNRRAALDDARHHIVGLKTDQHTYTAAELKKVIYRKDASPLLQGVSFNIAALSTKTKSVAAEIISSSGERW